jgi:hypothetical protein
MSDVIQKGDPLYQKLLDTWLAGGEEKGWVVLRGIGMFKVNRPSDDVITFTKDSSSGYESTSKI